VSLIALASLKGSPGVTTAGVALAATWNSDVVVAEVDPVGGDLAARFGLAEEPGLMSWAAAARRSSPIEELPLHVQGLPGGVRVLVGPAGTEQARGALRVLEGRSSLGFDSAPGFDVLADWGRLGPDGPSHPLFTQADLVLLLARPVLADLAHVASRVDSLRGGARDIAMVLVGPGPYPAGEIAATLGTEVIGELPLDPQGAALCSGSASASGRGVARSPLLRAARSLAEVMQHRLAGEGETIAEPEESVQSIPALEGTP
jgi:hypothetical protein